MREILLFSGTSEGRRMARTLSSLGRKVTVCVATEYGQEVMEEADYAKVVSGRRDAGQIEELIKSKRWEAVIDATHPYAREVTENIRRACASQNREVWRLLRERWEEETEEMPDIHYVSTVEEAADYLSLTSGRIFITTGSKELLKYTEKIRETSRLYVRILPGAEELKKCQELGLSGKQIVCMQGPFGEELNLALLNEVKAEYLVTKETGRAGGYPEKMRAAKRAGVKAVVIKRPEEEGYTPQEILKKLELEEKKLKKNPRIILAGIGIGTARNMTREVYQALLEAQVVIGAERMLQAVSAEVRMEEKEVLISYKAEEISEYICGTKADSIVILLSGDVGFYSGADRLLEQFRARGMEKTYGISLLCGVSSVMYFAAKLQVPWEDITLMSLHGRTQNVIGALRGTDRIMVLTDGAKSVRTLSQELLQYGFGEVRMYVGRQLGYAEEEILAGRPEEFQDYEKTGLHVVMLVKEERQNVTQGLPDAWFVRGNVPMTKEEVRSVSVSKLRLHGDSVVYDVGAGTGSVSVECARTVTRGRVYAIEKKPEALALIEKNKYKLASGNLEIVAGTAPEALEGLPAPTHAFIGGSSGKLEEIMKELWKKNPKVRVVLNAISLETLAEVTKLVKAYEFCEQEIVQIQVSKARKIGDYQMMTGQNPVYVVTLQR